MLLAERLARTVAPASAWNVLGVDVAYVALHHLARLAIVLVGAQLVFKTQKGWLGRGS